MARKKEIMSLVMTLNRNHISIEHSDTTLTRRVMPRDFASPNTIGTEADSLPLSATSFQII